VTRSAEVNSQAEIVQKNSKIMENKAPNKMSNNKSQTTSNNKQQQVVCCANGFFLTS
jgi:hypothetical protein